MARTSTHPPRVALYARVSTDKQSTENQLRELREVAVRLGWNVVGEFVDRGISGAKGPKDRPQLAALLRGVSRRDFDIVASWSVDRLGRSLMFWPWSAPSDERAMNCAATTYGKQVVSVYGRMPRSCRAMVRHFRLRVSV